MVLTIHIKSWMGHGLNYTRLVNAFMGYNSQNDSTNRIQILQQFKMNGPIFIATIYLYKRHYKTGVDY